MLVATAGTATATEPELVSIEWSPSGTFAHEAAIPPGKFVEVCGKLPARTQVAWQFDAGAPLNFNIHFHEGKKVRFPAKRDQVARSGGTLNAKVDQDYCWMWTNEAPTATTLKLNLKRA